jgi:hypothetical protein
MNDNKILFPKMRRIYHVGANHISATDFLPPEILCPVCGKLIPLFEKPTNPRRLVGACNCNGGRLREVIELDNPYYLSEEDILEPGEPASAPTPETSSSIPAEGTPSAKTRIRRK